MRTEASLETEIVETISLAEGLVLAVFSPQNIDRFVTIFRACRRAGRVFVGDAYLAHVLQVLDMPTLPRPQAGAFHVYVPDNQRKRILRAKSFDILEPFRKQRVFLEEIADNPARWVVLFRESMVAEIGRLSTKPPMTVLYSLWPGYLEKPESVLHDWCTERNALLITSHVSGHATPTDLARFVEAVRPRRVVPIHTQVPHRFSQFFSNAHVLADGEWSEV